jgi:DNA-binding LacI/PurR family transcriptional regulator
LLENLVRVTRTACWILNLAPAEVQRWFSDTGTPCLLAGSRHESIRLPALDFDYRAVSHHAAGLFRRNGHRRVALVIPRSHLVGDRVTERGFREGFTGSSESPPGEVVTAGHDGTVKGICSALDLVFRSGKPPTGLFVSHPHHVLTVISHLSHRHLRVPEEVSLVSRHHDFFLESLTPSIACYEFSLNYYALRLARMAVQLANRGALSSRQFLAAGKYIKGESLAPPRKRVEMKATDQV